MITRKKEIEQAMKEYVAETIYASGWGMTPQATDLLECAFTKGAEWADRTMLDKVCEWLRENIDLYAYNSFSMKSGCTEIRLTDVFETAFKKAMKE